MLTKRIFRLARNPLDLVWLELANVEVWISKLSKFAKFESRKQRRTSLTGLQIHTVELLEFCIEVCELGCSAVLLTSQLR